MQVTLRIYDIKYVFNMKRFRVIFFFLSLNYGNSDYLKESKIVQLFGILRRAVNIQKNFSICF